MSRAVFSTTALDTEDAGAVSSITVGTDCLGLIASRDDSNSELTLKVAHCSNTGCTDATLSTVDPVGNVGDGISITVGTDGLGLIAYWDSTNRDLKVAHCDNINCTTATSNAIDTAGDVGSQPSITIGTDGLGLISYYDQGNGHLKVAHCANVACTSASPAPSTIDNAPDVGGTSSITIGRDGLGLVAYRDQTNRDLKVAHCSNVTCTAADFVSSIVTAGDVGANPSIAVGSDGLGLISYQDNGTPQIMIAHCADGPCTAADSVSTLDGPFALPGNTLSIAMATDGLGLISYLDQTNTTLKVAHCDNVKCTTAVRSTLDGSSSNVGQNSSIVVGMDGMALISYWDNANFDLKVAHCSNTHCIFARWIR